MPVQVKTYPTIAEAAAALASLRGARFHGGGTLLMRAVNEGDTTIEALLRSTDPALTAIRASGGRVELGAGVTMANLLAERDLAFLHPVARAVGGPALRNAATIGGNLFASAPYGDFGAALLALDATVSVNGGYGGGRAMSLSEFYAARGRAGFGLVASVSFNRPIDGTFRFRKVSRVRPKGISVLTIAAHLPGGVRLANARVVYNAMAETPMRAQAVERVLEGRALDPATVAEARRVAAEGTNPATDPIATSWYRREVVGVYLQRLLLGEAE